MTPSKSLELLKSKLRRENAEANRKGSIFAGGLGGMVGVGALAWATQKFPNAASLGPVPTSGIIGGTAVAVAMGSKGETSNALFGFGLPMLGVATWQATQKQLGGG